MDKEEEKEVIEKLLNLWYKIPIQKNKE